MSIYLSMMMSQERTSSIWYETISYPSSAPAQQSKHTAMWWWCSDHPWFYVCYDIATKSSYRRWIWLPTVQFRVWFASTCRIVLTSCVHDAVGVMRCCVPDPSMNWCSSSRWSVVVSRILMNSCCWRFDIGWSVAVFSDCWTYSGDFNVTFWSCYGLMPSVCGILVGLWTVREAIWRCWN